MSISKKTGSSLRGILILIVSLGLSLHSAAQNDGARTLFADNKAAILQIRIIDLTSGSKSAIGSGFVVNNSGLIATNYHVVQMAASEPDQYRIEYLSADGATNSLSLVDVDVINDLALVKADTEMLSVLPLAADEPPIGVPVYALGNPLDLGLTVVPGTYNGINRTGYHPRVHFTGSLNPGMSGGPTLNTAGQVVGINVSTAGNQISFLVPVTALAHLIAEYTERAAGVADIKQRIGQQLLADQDKKFAQLLALEWPTLALGDAVVADELSPFLKCWGGSNSSSPKAQFLSADRTCRSEDNIYLNAKFNSGVIEHQFFWLQANKLNSLQFYAYYERMLSDFAPGNRGTEKDLGGWECVSQFVAAEGSQFLAAEGSIFPAAEGSQFLADEGSQFIDAGSAADSAIKDSRTTKVVFCSRAYKDYPGLYDILFLQGTVDDSRAAFVSHFTLAGVSQKNAKAYARKFMGVSKWP